MWNYSAVWLKHEFFKYPYFYEAHLSPSFLSGFELEYIYFHSIFGFHPLIRNYQLPQFFHYLQCALQLGNNSVMDMYPIIKPLNFLNSCPCSGFVEKTSTITCAGKYSILSSYLLTRSLTKKSWVCMHIKFPVQEFLPLCSMHI